MFSSGKPIRVGNFEIWPDSLPADHQAPAGVTSMIVRTDDPLFAVFAERVAAEGWSETEIGNALGMYAAALDQAGDSGPLGDPNTTMARLAEVVGEDEAAGYGGLLAAAAPEQLAIIGGMVDRMGERAEPVTADAPSATTNAPTDAPKEWNPDTLRAAVADPRFYSDAGYRVKVEAGFASVYGTEPDPRHQKVERGTDLKALVSDPRYADEQHPGHKAYRAEVEAAYRCKYGGEVDFK